MEQHEINVYNMNKASPSHRAEKITTIVGLSGSLRRGSLNTALLHAAAQLMPDDAKLEVKTIHGIPLYNADEEQAGGIPPVVSELKENIAASKGLLLVTPEYNNSIPGAFKNAIDWLSRPSDDIERIFGGRPVAIIGATTGGFGTVLGQDAWLPVLRALKTKPWFGGRLVVPYATKAFDESGRITDEMIKARLQGFLKGFVKFANE